MSDTNIMTGVLKLKAETQTFASGFCKREFVITTEDPKYPQDIKFEVLKDECDKLDSHKVGDTLEVHFNIRGNEYNDKYYINLQCWRIVSVGAGKGQPATSQQAAKADPMDNNLDEADSIPL